MPTSRVGLGHEEGLPERIRGGDGAAETEFALRYREPVRVLMLVRTRSREIAEDLAQEALLAALSSLREGRLRAPESLPAFVLGTARNVLNSWFRTNDRHPAEVPLRDDLVADRPEESIEEAERRALVRSAIARLAGVDQAILRMTVEGMESPEIAGALGMRRETVRARKSRAVKKIVDLLHRAGGEPGSRPLSTAGSRGLRAH